ncbi:MAG: tandem-95 repeat protein [Bacillota bacterium]
MTRLRSFLSGLLVILMLLNGLALPAQAAAEELDQSQTLQEGFQYCKANYACAQVFTAGKNGGVTRVRVLVAKESGTGDLLLQVRALNSSGEPIGTTLASEAVAAADVPGAGSPAWVDVTFATPASVTAGTQYALYMTAQPDTVYHWYDSRLNPYAGGREWLQDTDGTWDPFSNNDLAFETYVTPLPNNAQLSDLTVSAGTLSPAFSSTTYSYTVVVPNGVTSLVVTPTTDDPNAIAKVNGSDPSTPVPLKVGDNAIDVVVTAADLVTTKTYSINAHRNALPTITGPSDQTIQEDTSTGPVPFTVGDAETPADSLLLSATSLNPEIVPVSNIFLSGSGTDRTIRVTPSPNAFGTATIEIQASDGMDVRTKQFKVYVTAVNDPPTISAIADQSMPEDGTLDVAFTVNDPDGLLDSLTITPKSSDQAVLPNTQLFVGGTGSNRTLTIAHQGLPGTTTISVTVSDGSATDTSSFGLTLNPVNDAPVISTLANKTILEDTENFSFSFTVSDEETAAGSLLINVLSSDPSLVPESTATITNTGGNVTVTMHPTPDMIGSTTITVSVSDGAATTTSSFTLTIVESNDPPVIGPVSDQTTDEDTILGPIDVTVSDVDTPVADLLLTATSSNTALVPNANIAVGGSDSVRTLTITPAANQSGSTTITLTLNDGLSQTTKSFKLTVNPVNDPPTISEIPDMTVAQGDPVPTVSFTVGDLETAAGSLVVTASSSDTSVVPESGLKLGGTGSTRSLSITPTGAGTTIITVTVSDGSQTAADSFVLTVSQRPTISPIADVTVDEDNSTGPIAFTIGDLETSASALILSGSSSNQSLVPDGNILFGGAGSNRTVTVTPYANAYGTATITITVTDGDGLSSSRSFLLTVNSINDLPAISAIADITAPEDATIGPIAFTVADVETSAAALEIVVLSSNTSLVPNSAFILDGAGENRTLTFKPAAEQSGSTTITISVSDGIGATTESFNLTVTAVDDPPRFIMPSNPSVLEDSSITVDVSAEDVDSPLGTYTLTAVSLDQVKVPDANISVTGSSPNWSVTITPGPNQSGSVAIRLTATDVDTAFSFSDDMLLSIVDINDPPTLSAFTNQATTEDTPILDIPFTVGDIETAADDLLISASSDNPQLLPLDSFVFGGSGTSRTLSIYPAEDQYGTAGVFVTIDDGTDKVVRSFIVDVTSVADAPRLKGLSPQTIKEDEVLKMSVVVYDPDSSLSTVSVSFSSDNQALIPDANIELVGTGANRTLVITPTADYSGLATITVTSTGEGLTSVQSFPVTVEPVNDLPLISLIPDLTVLEDSTPGPLSFTVGDVETPAAELTVTATSSDKTLVPDANILIGGSGPTRTITVTPAPNRFGSATITVSVSDGAATAKETFQVKVTGVNDAPSFTLAGDLLVDEDDGKQSLTGFASSISAGPYETGQKLTFEVSVDNPTLFEFLPKITSSGQLTFTTALHAFGSATVTVRLLDDGGVANGGVSVSGDQSFTITVSPINDLPQISAVPGQGTEEGTPTPELAFTVSDVETTAAALVVTASSSNKTLVPDENIELGGINGDRWVRVRPAPGRIGTTTITLTVSDGTGSNSTSFIVIVNDVKLAELTPSVGVFTPPFTPNTLEYTAIYTGVQTTATLTPVGFDPDVTISVNNNVVQSGEESPPIELLENGGLAEIRIVAPTGISRTYKVRFLRAPSNITDLIELSLSRGTLEPAFDPAVTEYTATVENFVESVTVHARPGDGRSKVLIDGGEELQVGSNLIQVLVIAENGERKMYRITVTRDKGALGLTNVKLEPGAEYAAITFTTDAPAEAVVYYKASGSAKEESVSGPLTSNHRLSLGPLQPATTYTFRIVATREDETSAGYSSFFTTEEPPEVSICPGGEIRTEGPRTVLVRCPGDAEANRAVESAFLTPQPEGTVATTTVIDEQMMREALRQAGIQPGSDLPATVVIRTSGGGEMQSAVIDSAAAQRAVAMNSAIEIRSDFGSLTLPPLAVAGANQNPFGRLVILFRRLPEDREDLKPWLQDDVVRQLSSVVDVSVVTVFDDGRVERHDRFGAPVLLKLRTDKEPITDPKLVGVYCLVENRRTGEIVDRSYAGGRVDLEAGTIAAELKHLSTYVALHHEAKFTDVPTSHWGYSIVQQMAARQVIRGKTETLFEPDTPVTRAQVAAMLVRAMRLDKDERYAYVYSDIQRGDPLAGEIGGAVMAGLMMGYPDGTFHPDALITRQELAVVLTRLQVRLNLATGVESGLAAQRVAALQDLDSVAPWARQAVQNAIAQGLMTGRENGTFSPEGNTTRVEAATVVKRLIDWVEGYSQ